MSLARGSVNVDENELRAATYKRPNSPIFAPFMINVVCNLLNNSDLMQYQQPLNIEDWIGKWGGGLKLLKHCYPDWDKCIHESCQIATVNHKIWKKFLKYHNIPNIETFNNIRILQTLLDYWREKGKNVNTYGPYPTPFEQQEFQNVVTYPMGYITQAIADLKFEPCFQRNKSGIHTFIQQQKQQKKQQHQLMDEDGKDEYKGNNNRINNNNSPFNYDSKQPWNWNIHSNQSDNFRGHSANGNNNNNFSGFREEKKEMILNNNSRGGVIYYQSAYYSIKQLQNISMYFKFNKENVPKLLFGDNNIDKYRPLYQNRLYFGGQAQELGNYDRWFGYGITTTLKPPIMNEQSSLFQQTQQVNTKFEYNQFRTMMDKEFKSLIDHLAHGRDIIVPSPNNNDLRENSNKYLDAFGQRKFRHNLGTGTADLEEKYLKYIQLKLDQLEAYASSVQYITSPKLYENRTTPMFNRPQSSNQRQHRIQKPVTLTPRQKQRRYRRDSNGLNLPFNTDEPWDMNVNTPINSNISQRLKFDDEKQQDFNANERKDLYGSIHYESPQHRPRAQQRMGRNGYGQMQQNNGQERNNDFQQTRAQNSLLNNSPIRDENKLLPHYKSPKRYVTRSEWQQLSSPDNRNRNRNSVVRYGNDSGNDGMGIRNRILEDDMLKNIINWCLFVLFYIPRKIYIALVVQNRPQDVFKMISIVLMGIGVVHCVMYWDVTSMGLICFIGGIVCALGGGDRFYANRPKIRGDVNEGHDNRYNERNNNRRMRNGYFQNDINSSFNYN